MFSPLVSRAGLFEGVEGGSRSDGPSGTVRPLLVVGGDEAIDLALELDDGAGR